MTSQRPYLLRALYAWIVDNGMTPHVVADAREPGVHVPVSAIRDGQVVLNIAERAVSQLRMDDDMIVFNARFGGVSHAVFVPMGAVLAIYARETGMGMALPPDPVAQEGTDPVEDQPSTVPVASAPTMSKEPRRPALQSVGSDDAPTPDDGAPSTPSPPNGKRGAHLKVVK